ncbi:HEAT repeat domain-containing protein [Streptomyces sp. NPDC001922]|uniref:HEAT repeat domain-containing protein n=1 Tax=Streptomyces sp. NPDC001922 TaxID=3364624 RepID=UPI0036B1DFCF
MTAVLTGAVFLAAMLAVVAGLGLFIVGVRLLRLVRERRRARLTAPLRILLIELTCEDEAEETAAARQLAGLDRRRWAALEPMASALLGKVTGRARTALVGVFERHGAVEQARARLRRHGSVGRARAAELLGSLGHREAAPALIPLLHSRDPDLRATAARALGRLGDSGAVPALLDCLSGRRRVPPPVVTEALVGLGPDAEGAIAAGLRHSDALARAVAVEALAATGSPAQTDALAAALTGDPSPEVRVRAARALGTIGAPGGLEPLLEAVDPAHPTVLRATAAEALGSVGAAGTAPRLRALLADPAHRVAAAAATALDRLGPAGRHELEVAARGGDGPRAAAHAVAVLAEAALPAAQSASDAAGTAW